MYNNKIMTHKENTSKHKSRRRRDALDAAAQAAGFSTHTKLLTAVANGHPLVPNDPQLVAIIQRVLDALTQPGVILDDAHGTIERHTTNSVDGMALHIQAVPNGWRTIAIHYQQIETDTTN